MSASLVAACALYALMLGCWSSARAVRGIPPTGLPGLAAALLGGVQALVATVAAAVLLAGGGDPEQPASAWGYLVATAALMPITYALREDRDGWDSLILALGCFALAVANWRLTIVWGR